MTGCDHEREREMDIMIFGLEKVSLNKLKAISFCVWVSIMRASVCECLAYRMLFSIMYSSKWFLGCVYVKIISTYCYFHFSCCCCCKVSIQRYASKSAVFFLYSLRKEHFFNNNHNLFSFFIISEHMKCLQKFNLIWVVFYKIFDLLLI